MCLRQVFHVTFRPIVRLVCSQDTAFSILMTIQVNVGMVALCKPFRGKYDGRPTMMGTMHSL